MGNFACRGVSATRSRPVDIFRVPARELFTLYPPCCSLHPFTQLSESVVFPCDIRCFTMPGSENIPQYVYVLQIAFLTGPPVPVMLKLLPFAIALIYVAGAWQHPSLSLLIHYNDLAFAWRTCLRNSNRALEEPASLNWVIFWWRAHDVCIRRPEGGRISWVGCSNRHG